MNRVKELIASKKSNSVASIGADDTVLKSARDMNEMRIGSLVVTEGDKVIGILSERDILVRVVAEPRDPGDTKVSEVMTSPCVVVGPEDTLDHCQAIMTQKRIRHLPVVEDGSLIGMVTPGDIMAAAHRDREVEIQYLQSYLYGSAG